MALIRLHFLNQLHLHCAVCVRPRALPAWASPCPPSLRIRRRRARARAPRRRPTRRTWRTWDSEPLASIFLYFWAVWKGLGITRRVARRQRQRMGIPESRLQGEVQCMRMHEVWDLKHLVSTMRTYRNGFEVGRSHDGRSTVPPTKQKPIPGLPGPPNRRTVSKTMRS